MWRLELFIAGCLLVSPCLAADEGAAQILQYDFQRDGDANYRYSFETSNGVKRNETGEDIPSIHDASNNAALVRGSFSYRGADGVVYLVNYVADEAGFHPEGAHLQIPPFTPWIPGQPIDNGQYKEDKSGNYKRDKSGKYTPGKGERGLDPFTKPKQSQTSFTSGERILNDYRTTPQPPTSNTQKYLPTRHPQKTNYVSGESILDTYLTAETLPDTVTPKYLPASSTTQSHFVSGVKTPDSFRQSYRPTPKYLPSRPTDEPEISFFNTENPLDNDIIKKAFFNKPTPHPDILLHSTPNDHKLAGATTQNRPRYVRFSLPQKKVTSARKARVA